jgi:DNA polymerase-3 subunit epsilon
MRIPLQPLCQTGRTLRSLPPDLRERIGRLPSARRLRSVAGQPLALTRFVAIDLETTGPRMLSDRIIAVGAVAVTAGAVRHADAFEAVVRQARSSGNDNILVHQIGGQQQLAGTEPGETLVQFLEYLGDSVAVAYRAEFDATVLGRELRACLGMRLHTRFLDLACILPALFPWTDNDSLDDWAAHLGLPPIGRHVAIADAYANAQLLLLALEQARRHGIETTAQLLELERAQRWLGRRR